MAMNAMEPTARIDRRARLAWLPIPLLLLAMAVLWVADSPAVYEPPQLMIALNLIFMLPAALLIAYQAGRGFLLRGSPRLLWFGCGMLFWGAAGPVGGALLPHGPAVTVTVHNSLIWLAAACHAAGVVLVPPQRAVRWPEPWLAGAYAGAVTLGTAIVLETLAGGMPTFFVQGEGGTLLRQVVLGSAVAMFVLTTFLLKVNRRDSPSAFRDWYTLALLLIAVGLFGVMIQSNFGSALGWAGRIAQYLGGVYLLVAAVVGMSETRDLGRSLEMALGEARQRFDELIDLAGDGIALHELIDETSRGNFIQVNPALCALLGYTAQEMRALMPLDIMAPEDREKVAGDVGAMRDAGLLRHEKTLVAKDGRRIPVEISTRQYRHAGRAMVVSVIRDVTERKRAEAALRESEQFKQAVLDAVNAHVAVLDRDGRIVAVNEPWRRFAVENGGRASLMAPRTDVGTNYLAICLEARGEGAEGALAARDGIEAVLAGEAKVFSHEYPCHSPRAKRWYSMIVTPLGSKRGGAVVSHLDITASRQLAEQLRGERDRFAKIATTVPGVICSFRLDPDGNACFPYASPAIEDLYGLGPDDLVESAAPLWAMMHPDDLGRIDLSIADSARSMTPWRDEFRVRHPTKGEIWVEGHSMPVREPDGGILWHGYLQDITDRKRAEAVVRAALEEKEVLLREVHHRVKNNLASIIDLLELQRDGATEASTVSLLTQLSLRIRSMALVHEMLYQSENIGRVDFSGYLRALVAHLRDAYDPGGAIRLAVTAPDIWMDLDTAIPCGLIVNELVTNAYKYAFPAHRPQPEGSAREIAVAASGDGAAYTLTVADNGVGLPAGLDWTTTRTLGLRLARMLGQHQLGGQLALDGIGGTRFALRFGVRRRSGREIA